MSKPMLNPQQREELLTIARQSIRYGLSRGKALPVAPSEFDAPLSEVLASFVTLQRNGRLRGCIGSLEARLALVEDVSQHAFQAAFRDPRFAPLAEVEYVDLSVEISILSPTQEMDISGEEDLLQQLRPGLDGLIIADGAHRATFLPSVWASLPRPRDFLEALKQKAGLAYGEIQQLKAWRYSTESFGEH